MIIIDRLTKEEGFLEIEGEIVLVPRRLLPKRAKEGDCLLSTPDGYVVDKSGTAARRESIQSLFDSLKKE